MELHPLLILAILFMATTASQATHPSDPFEEYWNSLLPNTKMPKAIRNIIPTGDTGSLPKDLSHRLQDDDKEKYDGHPSSERGYNTMEVHLFLREKDIVPGKQMDVEFAERSKATFLPRKVADSLPFSSDKMPEILKVFSVKPNTIEAQNIIEVVRDCEEPPNKGEKKLCATSMESMMEFSLSQLGKNVGAFSTEIEGEFRKMQKYTIMYGVKKLASGKSVVCHKLNYAYAVFKCHEVPATTAYAVPLRGNDGTHVNAFVVCHQDTSTWDPSHLAFRVLNIKQGTAVCHFTIEQTVLWIGN